MESIPADINVLFVDGDAGVRSEAKKHLELADGRINVETAASGEKSLESLKTVTYEDAHHGYPKDYDLVILGHGSDDMPPQEFLKRLRSEKHNDIPVVLYLSPKRLDMSYKDRETGADGHVNSTGDPKKNRYSLLAYEIFKVLKERKVVIGG